MRSTYTVVAFVLAFGLAVTAPGEAGAADPPAVLQAVVIDTNGNTDALLADAKKNEKIFERLGIKAQRRYLRATLAGDESGSIAVIIDYPNLESFAAAQAKLQNDSEWQAYIQKINSSGMTVESNSMWVDITP